MVGYAKPGRDVNGLRNLIAVDQPRKVRQSVRNHGLISVLGHAHSRDASGCGRAYKRMISAGLAVRTLYHNEGPYESNGTRPAGARMILCPNWSGAAFNNGLAPWRRTPIATEL